MDFNTGSGSGRPEDRPLYGGDAGGSARAPAPGPAGGTGGEFNRQDPVGSFIRTVAMVATQPVAFFRSMARQGDFVNPLIFALICALISALLSGIIGLILAPLLASPGETGEAFVGGIGGFVAGVILWPIYGAIAVGIGAGILHLLVLLLVRPSNAGFEATFRAVSYAWGETQLISWIPILGSIIAFVWAVVLYILGIREVHATTTGIAALIVLIPIGLLVFGLILVTTLLGAYWFAAGNQ
jgi:hypothetical protein